MPSLGILLSSNFHIFTNPEVLQIPSFVFLWELYYTDNVWLNHWPLGIELNLYLPESPLPEGEGGKLQFS